MKKKEYIIPQMVVVRLESPVCLSSTSEIVTPIDPEDPDEDGVGNGEGEWDY